jgi:hypothetical protein
MCQIQKGVLVPSNDDLNVIVKQMFVDIKGDGDRANYFKSNPVGYVSALGLNIDTTREILNDIGLGYAQAACADWCIITCICTDCCITNIGHVTIVVAVA